MPVESEVFAIPEDEESTLRVLMEQLPFTLRYAIKRFMGDAKNIPRIKHPDNTRETTEEYLCRLAGVDGKHVNLSELIRDHFS